MEIKMKQLTLAALAAVALTSARLQAIVIHTRQDADMLVGQVRQDSNNATGDLAADLVGIDVGL